MVLGDQSGRIRTRELEEEALRNDWTIETNRGGRRTAIARMDHTTGATKMRKQTVWSEFKLRGQNGTQKITVETSKNNSTIEIDLGGHRGEKLLLEELRPPLDLSITSHERKQPTVSWWSSRSWSLRNAQANYLFQSISGSKVMLWNFESVKCLDKHVEQDDGRKSGGWEAEPQERTQKELACLQHGGSFRGFRLNCPSRI